MQTAESASSDSSKTELSEEELRAITERVLQENYTVGNLAFSKEFIELFTYYQYEAYKRTLFRNLFLDPKADALCLSENDFAILYRDQAWIALPIDPYPETHCDSSVTEQLQAGMPWWEWFPILGSLPNFGVYTEDVMSESGSKQLVHHEYYLLSDATILDLGWQIDPEERVRSFTLTSIGILSVDELLLIGKGTNREVSKPYDPRENDEDWKTAYRWPDGYLPDFFVTKYHYDAPDNKPTVDDHPVPINLQKYREPDPGLYQYPEAKMTTEENVKWIILHNPTVADLRFAKEFVSETCEKLYAEIEKRYETYREERPGSGALYDSDTFSAAQKNTKDFFRVFDPDPRHVRSIEAASRLNAGMTYAECCEILDGLPTFGYDRSDSDLSERYLHQYYVLENGSVLHLRLSRQDGSRFVLKDRETISFSELAQTGKDDPESPKTLFDPRSDAFARDFYGWPDGYLPDYFVTQYG